MEIRTKYSIGDTVYFKNGEGIGYGRVDEIIISKPYGNNGFKFTYKLGSTTCDELGTYSEDSISSTPKEAMNKLKAEAKRKYDKRIADIDKMATQEGIDQYEKD